MQVVDKKDAHSMINDAMGIAVTEYDFGKGLSRKIKKIEKFKGKWLIKKAKTVIMTGKNPMIILELHDKIIENLENYPREGIIKKLLLYIKE